MTWMDLLALAFGSLRQQKVRTVLTTLGVMFGSLVLAATLAIGQGVQRAIRNLTDEELLRRVEVWPDWDGAARGPSSQPAIQVDGEMSETRRERIRSALAVRQAASSGRPRVSLSQENLARLRALPHVQRVVPLAWQDGYAVLDGRSEITDIGAAEPHDADCRRRIVAGRFFDAPDEPGIVVSEALLYLLGFKEESAMNEVLGRQLRIELRVRKRTGLGVSINHPLGSETSRQESMLAEKITGQLPRLLDQLDLAAPEKEFVRALVASQPAEASQLRWREFPIVGVMRAPSEDERKQRWHGLLIEGDVTLPVQTATDLFFHLQGTAQRSVHRAVLIADREENVERLMTAVRELGFEAYAPLEHLKQARLMYLLIFSGTTCVALVSLLVAGLGIANIMLISVLQRTREIGIMKAVGADSRDLQVSFLIEGAIIGVVGGGLGLLAAWAASFPADAWTASIASRDLGVELKESLWSFPPWIILTVFSVAVAVTVMAAVYPSRRASRIDPVAALRYE